MGLLIIDALTRERAKEIIDYATAHPMKFEDLKKVVSGELPCAGKNPFCVMQIFTDHRVVYSHEEQESDKEFRSMFRHLSVSVGKPGCYPSTFAVDMILELFGFRGRCFKTKNILIYQEHEDKNQAINILEVINPDHEPYFFIVKLETDK